jgi:hypothetical protein
LESLFRYRFEKIEEILGKWAAPLSHFA